MAGKRPKTIAEYIAAAPTASKAHLEELYALLKSVAPKASEAIKWGQPFLVEPRFLFAFAAYKAHLSFTASKDVLDPFRDQLQGYEITPMGIVKLPYSKPIPATVIKKIARAQLKRVKAREDDGFW